MLQLNHSDYPIHLSEGTEVLEQLQSQIEAHSSTHIICDSNTAQFCLPILEKYLAQNPYQVHSFSAGEKHKNFETVSNLYEALLNTNADRKALVINLGGGVVGDLGGFAAATYKRGIDFVQIPTSLLAMVDATIGGKLGYNFKGVKNAIGVFENPEMVLISNAFLETLPDDERLSGWGEMLKHALIADAEYWEELCAFDISKHKNLPVNFIEKSLRIKLEVVHSDPFEQNRRKLLNLGHTLGHALESVAIEKGQDLPHGAAVAFGILGESFAANSLGLLSEIDLKKIVAYIQPLYGSYFVNEIDFQEVLKWIKNDKKNTSGELNFTFLRKIGTAEYNHSLEIDYIQRMINWLNSIYEV